MCDEFDSVVALIALTSQANIPDVMSRNQAENWDGIEDW